MYPSSAAPFTMAVSKIALEETGMLDRINMEGDRTWTTERVRITFKRCGKSWI